MYHVNIKSRSQIPHSEREFGSIDLVGGFVPSQLQHAKFYLDGCRVSENGEDIYLAEFLTGEFDVNVGLRFWWISNRDKSLKCSPPMEGLFISFKSIYDQTIEFVKLSSTAKPEEFKINEWSAFFGVNRDTVILGSKEIKFADGQLGKAYQVPQGVLVWTHDKELNLKLYDENLKLKKSAGAPAEFKGSERWLKNLKKTNNNFTIENALGALYQIQLENLELKLNQETK